MQAVTYASSISKIWICTKTRLPARTRFHRFSFCSWLKLFRPVGYVSLEMEFGIIAYLCYFCQSQSLHTINIQWRTEGAHKSVEAKPLPKLQNSLGNSKISANSNNIPHFRSGDYKMALNSVCRFNEQREANNYIPLPRPLRTALVTNM